MLRKLGLIVIPITFLMYSCTKVYDQTIPEDNKIYQEIVNEAPELRDFFKNNSSHKVLVAVVDTGVDYNHPLLKDNIHFTLNERGLPVGAGYDFVAKDKWASPYIANTLLLDFDAKKNYEEDSKLSEEKRNFTITGSELVF